MRIHAIQTGSLVGNRTFLRSERFSSMLRPAEPIEFPVLAFVIEHPDGLIAIDTGANARTRTPRWQRRFAPVPHVRPEDEIGPQLRARGIDPADVRRVVLTHLDWDHVGGVSHFPGAELLVHRPEWAFAHTLAGRSRFQAARWAFSPTLVDLDEGAYGPFERSLTVAEGVIIVPLAGHTPGQVGLIVRDRDTEWLFAADHVLRADWFAEDLAAGRELGLGIWNRREAVETTRRMRRFLDERSARLLPSHDAEVPARLRVALRA